MAQSLYIILLIISGVELIYFLATTQDYVTANYELVFSLAAICILGYIWLINATTLEEALLANHVTYIGGVFFPYLMMLCILRLCHFKHYNIVMCTGFVACCLLYALVCTIGHCSWYYRSIEMVRINDITYLVKSYGPLHNVYLLVEMIFMIIGMVAIVRAFFAQEDTPLRNSVTLAGVLVANFVVYMGERMMHTKIDYLPVTYVISETAILYLVQHHKKYDIDNMIWNSLTRTQEYGYVTFDCDGNYMGCDANAKTWFPELENLILERPILRTNTEFLHYIEKCFQSDGNIHHQYIECQDLIIRCKFKAATDKKNQVFAYYMELIDDTERQKYIKIVNHFNEELQVDVACKTEHLKNIQQDIILSMADTVENRDSSTGGHIKRTSEGVRIFANRLMTERGYMERGREYYERVIDATPLHDFGKIAIADNILNKPGKFTEEEYAEMKHHPEKGAKIVAQILQNSEDEEFREIAINVAHYHHERWDGGGYPDRLEGTEIPFEARIMALADVFDALVSKRCYKDKYPYDKAFSIIEDCLGTQFDPDLGRVFLACRKELETLYNQFPDE